MPKTKTSGMSISVTDDERRVITEVESLTGLKRKALIMSLIRAELRRLVKNGA